LGKTYEELGGTEYTDSIGYSEYGNVPKVDLEIDRKNNSVVLALIQHGLIDFAHDCSKGGIGAALAELAISGNVGIDIDLEKIPNNCSRHDYLLFSESHSRFIIGSKQPDRVKEILRSKRCIFSEIGEVETTKILNIHYSRKEIINLPVNDLAYSYNTINHIMDGT
jgi:phosphoribosylformylglycinamidine synthase